jgi:hypothetical protein
MIDKVAINVDEQRGVVTFSVHRRSELELPRSVDVPVQAVLAVAGSLMMRMFGTGNAPASPIVLKPDPDRPL